MIHWEKEKTKCRNQKMIIRIYFYSIAVANLSNESRFGTRTLLILILIFDAAADDIRNEDQQKWILIQNIWICYELNDPEYNYWFELNWNSDVIDLIDVQWLIHTSSTIKVNVVVNDNASIQNAKKERKLMWSIYNPPQWVVNFHIIKEMLTSRVCIITEKSENKSNPIVCYSV